MKTNTPMTQTCIDGKAHDWKVARIRANKQRMQCKQCQIMTGWQHKPLDFDGAVSQAKAVEQGQKPSGSVVVKVTGDNSLHSNYPEPSVRGNMTVAELKAELKALGLSGYSKMKRDELMELLRSVKA